MWTPSPIASSPCSTSCDRRPRGGYGSGSRSWFVCSPNSTAQAWPGRLELADDHPGLITRLGRDELVGSLLVLHGLHPDSLEQRVARAVGSVAPLVTKGGASIEVTALDSEAAAVSVTVTAPGSGCGSTGEVLCDTVRQALADAAPDATSK